MSSSTLSVNSQNRQWMSSRCGRPSAKQTITGLPSIGASRQKQGENVTLHDGLAVGLIVEAGRGGGIAQLGDMPGDRPALVVAIDVLPTERWIGPVVDAVRNRAHPGDQRLVERIACLARRDVDPRRLCGVHVSSSLHIAVGATRLDPSQAATATGAMGLIRLNIASA